MVPAGGPVEPVLIKFQTLLANALAMLQLVHLTVVKRFHFKFNELALASPYDSSLRSWQLTKLSGQQWPVRLKVVQHPVTPKKTDPPVAPKKTGNAPPIKKDSPRKITAETKAALQAWRDTNYGGYPISSQHGSSITYSTFSFCRRMCFSS
ncbi:unnamed protein product [Cladocopium goreaui]|uniref:Uncharacterized protein n=1 Tax=Cladocopium goreaui TaxID=2562237 RepID=A0A9P1DGF4_9DINO|nr:unnamed protein product [Cladocopium goreaui]